MVNLDIPVTSDPCNPSPCGPYSQCRNSDNHAVCSCLPNYMGSPPSCRPECTVSSECNPDKACVNTKCINPCIGACGSGARCEVINHSPICSCREGQTGDPFRSCYTIPSKYLQTIYILKSSIFNICNVFFFRTNTSTSIRSPN